MIARVALALTVILVGVLAILAALGGLMYIVVVVGSILFGKPVEKKIELQEPLRPAPVATYGSAGTMAIPGTAVMVAVFFTAFVLYYFVNWKYLSEVWPLQ